MKIGIAQTDASSVLAAQTANGVVDLSKAGPWKSVIDVIRDWGAARDKLDACTALIPVPVRWLVPIPSPPKFLLLAGNFRAHVVESGFAALPEDNMTPQFFMKPASTIIGDGENIPLTDRNVALDYEAEIAVVIGTRIKNASLEDAARAVWGYALVNDVSERKINENFAGRKLRQNDNFFDWLTGKWFDGSAPMGPVILTADEVADPSPLVLRGLLNGNVVQEAPVSSMVHSIPEAIQYISKIVTLEPGDVISMGTPAGVGLGTGRLLQDGDVFTCEIAEIGRLTNPVKFAAMR